MTDARDIAEQALVERQMLTYIEQALCVVLEWDTPQDNYARKLSTLRFTAQSFQRHLERMRALAEADGYLNLVLEAKPQLAGKVTTLEQRRCELQSVLDRLMAELDRVSPDDPAAFAALCSRLRDFLAQLEQHHRQEREVFQEALTREEGGSG